MENPMTGKIMLNLLLAWIYMGLTSGAALLIKHFWRELDSELRLVSILFVVWALVGIGIGFAYLMTNL